MTTTRNRVRYWAEQRGWDVQDIYKQALMKGEGIGLSTIYRLFDDATHLGNRKSLESLARVFDLRYTDMIEDVDVPEQVNNQ